MMKKIIALLCAAALCAVLFCVPVSAAMTAYQDNTVRIDSGFCNNSNMITWYFAKEEISGYGEQNVLEISPKNDPAFSDPDHPEYRVMKDYAVWEQYSTSPWTLVDSQPEKSRFVNVLIIKSGITVIGEYSFRGQAAMTAVTLYPTLKTVKKGAFSGCDGLTRVIFKGTKEQWDAIVIEDDNDPLLSAEVTFSDDTPAYLPGDLNEDDKVTDQDAIYLLFHTFFPEDYPVNQPVDFNGDSVVTDQDAIYLLFYTFFPDDYPIVK